MKALKKVLAVVMCCAMLIAVFVPMASAASKPTLKFDQNGRFRILFITDCHNNDQPYQELINFITTSVKYYKPDFVVFGGDNITGNWKHLTSSAVEAALKDLVKPIIKAGIPYTSVYGNHDWQSMATKQQQTRFFQSFSDLCLMEDGYEYLDRTANHNIMVKSSDGSKKIFNMWFVDSGTKNGITGDIEPVYEQQISWYKEKARDLKDSNGGEVVPAIWFQHIPVQQVSKVFSGSVKVPAKDLGEYAAWVKIGDVVGAFFGHDHQNEYSGVTNDGIMLTATKCAGFQSKGDVRGARIIDIDEDAVLAGDRDNMINTFSIYYSDFFDDEDTIEEKKDYDSSERWEEEGSYIGNWFKRFFKSLLKIITFGLYKG